MDEVKALIRISRKEVAFELLKDDLLMEDDKSAWIVITCSIDQSTLWHHFAISQADYAPLAYHQDFKSCPLYIDSSTDQPPSILQWPMFKLCRGYSQKSVRAMKFRLF